MTPTHALTNLSLHNRQAAQQLRLRWLWVAIAYGIVYGAGYLLFVLYGDYSHPANWLVWAALCMAAVLGIVWWILPYNHPPQTPRLFPTLGYGTALSLVCGALLFLLAGFLFAPQPSGLMAWIPALLYTAARLVDYLDGYVARITNHETKLGEILDIELDGLGMLIAISIAIQYGQLPIWYFPLGLARQLFIGGIWLRKRQNLPVNDLPPSDNRRVISGFQTGFVCAILWPVFEPPFSTLAATLFAIPLVASFVRDWLVVSNQIDPYSPGYLRWRELVKTVTEAWLPPIARLVGTALTVIVLAQVLPGLEAWRSWFGPSWVGQLAVPVLAGVFLVALPPFTLGIIGRLAAIAIIGLACLDGWIVGLNWTNGLLLTSAFVVAHFGSGRYALWSPEEAILRKRHGKPRVPASEKSTANVPVAPQTKAQRKPQAKSQKPLRGKSRRKPRA